MDARYLDRLDDETLRQRNEPSIDDLIAARDRARAAYVDLVRDLRARGWMQAGNRKETPGKDIPPDEAYLNAGIPLEFFERGRYGRRGVLERVDVAGVSVSSSDTVSTNVLASVAPQDARRAGTQCGLHESSVCGAD